MAQGSLRIQHCLRHCKNVSAVAGVLENHIDALDLSKEESKPEHEAYLELAKRHRDIASQLQAVADRMAGCRDLPSAAHDPAAMTSPKSLQSFEQLVESERELFRLLTIRVKENDSMLAEFPAGRAGVAGFPSGPSMPPQLIDQQ